MRDKIQLSAIAPEGKVFEADMDRVEVPGLDGELGILPGHTQPTKLHQELTRHLWNSLVLLTSVNNERRYERLLSTLWYCYYDSANHSQLEIARRLGVSDSLVSDSRKLIEHELRKLKLSIEEGAVFSESLQLLVTPSAEVH